MFVAVGAIVLAFTGAEALYADMGHFGKKPIQLAWTGLVLPALAINYMGQGALLMRDPAALENPFYRLFPQSWLIPAVVLATLATVIASQAVISGRLFHDPAGHAARAACRACGCSTPRPRRPGRSTCPR